MDKIERFRLPTPPKTALLKTESADECLKLERALNRDLDPVDAVEEMFVQDLINVEWEVRRYRRVKTAIINMELPSALSDLIMECRGASGEIPSFGDADAARLKVATWADPNPPTAEGERRRKAQKKAEELSRRWFTDQNAKREVAELLRRFNLDEDALEATAIRGLFEELDKCERLLTGSELRRNKALASLAAYRSSGMARPRAPTDRTLNDRPARRLGNSSNENSAD